MCTETFVWCRVTPRAGASIGQNHIIMQDLNLQHGAVSRQV